MLKAEPIGYSARFPGELMAWERAELFARVEGYVNTLRADMGDVVRQGQMLALLDAPELTAKTAEAAAAVAQAVARKAESADLYHRLRQAATTQGAVAAGDLVRAQSRLEADSFALSAAENAYHALKSQQEFLTIRAPFNGRITSRNAERGMLAGKGASLPLFVVESTNPLRLRMQAPEAILGGNLPRQIKFTLVAFPGDTFVGNLSRTSGSLNAQNRSEMWEFLVDNPNGRLKPGMFAEVFTQSHPLHTGFIVPPAAIVTSQERQFVIRIKNGAAEWVDVSKGLSAAGGTAITGSLTEGDTLLLRASDEIRPGQKIR